MYEPNLRYCSDVVQPDRTVCVSESRRSTQSAVGHPLLPTTMCSCGVLFRFILRYYRSVGIIRSWCLTLAQPPRRVSACTIASGHQMRWPVSCAQSHVPEAPLGGSEGSTGAEAEPFIPVGCLSIAPGFGRIPGIVSAENSRKDCPKEGKWA